MRAGNSTQNPGMTRRVGDVVLQVEDLRTYCFTRWGVVKAVDGVSFCRASGRNVGDSGRVRLRQEHDGALAVAPGTALR